MIDAVEGERDNSLLRLIERDEDIGLNPRSVFVEWRDATAVDTWLDKAAYQESINEGLHVVQTRGWLVHETDDFLAVARTVSKTAVEGLLLIPRCMIIIWTVTT